MRSGSIAKSDLSRLVDAVRATGRFLGPTVDERGARLLPLESGDRVCLDYVNLLLPAKRVFFPQSEVLLTFEGDAGEAKDAVSDEGATVVFGIRPCDANSLAYLDKVFLGDGVEDPYYRARRDAAVVISLACREPADTCFCTSVSGSPSGTDGADVIAFDLGDDLLLESVSEKGEKFLEAHAGILAPATDQQTSAKAAQAAAASARIEDVSVAGALENLPSAFGSTLWDDCSEGCLNCGVCTFVCPTCHCFGITDEAGGGTSRRIRAQHGCMFPTFTAEASGHNPRPDSGSRMRQRLMHKFRYTVESHGDVFCVGCGRCVESCPAGIDIRETLSEVTRWTP